eukprot:COSAG02_NODE_834_length_16653_cov_9.111977_12_plen_56_part_00
MRATLGTIFLPPERQYASTEDFGRGTTQADVSLTWALRRPRAGFANRGTIALLRP